MEATAKVNKEESSPSATLIEQFFTYIEQGDNFQVRTLLSQERQLTKIKNKSDNYRFDPAIELDAYKFLGAYLGALSGLQLSVLLGNTEIAKDIVDVTFDADLNMCFGDNNTTLHLAAFMENKEIVKLLLERGCDATIKNGKGFTPLDMSGDEEISKLLSNN